MLLRIQIFYRKQSWVTLILHFDWANFFAALCLTLRGYEAGLFHAYWVISSCGLCFCRCFLTGFDHRCSLPCTIKWSCSVPLFELLLLRLNNLSFFGLLRNAWTWMKQMNGPESWLSFPDLIWREVYWLDCRNTRQCICSDWKRLENQSENFQANSGVEEILSKPFSCSEEGF